MDIPRFLAKYIRDETGLRAEAHPSRADIKADHFIVMVENFWDEPGGTFQNVIDGDYTFMNGVPVEGFDQSLPMRVIWRSNCTGETWRADMIYRTQQNAMFFSAPFLLPVFGGKLVGTAADMMDDGQGADVADLDDWNIDGPGLGFVAAFRRDPASDKVFTPATKGRRQRSNGYIAEQHFVGWVFFKGGAEVPNDKRRHTQ